MMMMMTAHDDDDDDDDIATENKTHPLVTTSLLVSTAVAHLHIIFYTGHKLPKFNNQSLF